MNDDKKILEVLLKHHKTVEKQYTPVMTVLVGSQNYDLATENSDYDTFTFVLPDARDIATLRDPVSTRQEDEYGHINIKDIRLGLNLLKKTSPNSVECFASKYYTVRGGFEPMINLLRVPIMLRCDTHHMMSAIGGLSRQLTKRNMAPGKRLSHILRMECMVMKYFDLDSDLLTLFDEEHKLARQAKLDPDNPKWNDECDIHAMRVQEAIANVDINYFENTEDYARRTIEFVQLQMMKKVF